MAPITTIVHFSVPADNIDRFFAFWHHSIKDSASRQPGLIDGILHRGVDPDGPFQFINVARRDSAEQLESGLRATVEELHRGGVEMIEVFQELGVEISQNNYVESVRYTPIRDRPQTWWPGSSGPTRDRAVRPASAVRPERCASSQPGHRRTGEWPV